MNKYQIKQEVVNGRQQWVLRVNGEIFMTNGVRSVVEHAKYVHVRDNR